jgi:ppGpp synthetase/RelA/SpoT-type nucleotidyltranferase
VSGWGYEDVVARYSEELYPAYRRLAQDMAALVRRRLDEHGHHLVEVSHRAKDVDSFGKKAIRKGYVDPLTEIGDKAGVRVVLPFVRDKPEIERILAKTLILSGRDDKRLALGADRVGYLGLHFQAEIPAGELANDEQDLVGLQAELQLHTKAENAWSTATHDTLYKAPLPVPNQIARRINRLAVLAEVFDSEVRIFQDELLALPDFALLETLVPPLERELLRFTGRKPDLGLSRMILPAVAELTGLPADRIHPELVAPYLAQHESELKALYDDYESDDRANPLLFQPEALLIFERLASDRYRLRQAWPPSVPESVLFALARTRGVLYD